MICNTSLLNSVVSQVSTNGFIRFSKASNSPSSPTNIISTLLARKILRATSANFSGNNGKAAGLEASSLIF